MQRQAFRRRGIVVSSSSAPTAAGLFSQVLAGCSSATTHSMVGISSQSGDRTSSTNNRFNVASNFRRSVTGPWAYQ
ncbi:MAG: hypothetical protein KDA55_07515 [Planctomycetales bacterium]|nr:hypothetical protein [Planctomycetales bacterium]